MKTKQTSAMGIAKKAMPIALVYTIQQQTGVEAAQVDTQAHIQEIAGLVQASLAESALDSSVEQLSANEINAQIHSTIEEAIKSQSSQKVDEQANSKLGFLQKVVSLDCFFGGSDCLFKDKKSMMEGKVTQFAQKKFDEGNTNVSQYLAQVKQQVHQDLQANAAIKSIDRAQQQPFDHANLDVAQENMRVSENEKHLNKQLHDSVQGLLSLNQHKEEPAKAPAKSNLMKTPVAGHSGNLGPKEQLVKVPIDDYDSIGVVVSPTFPLDDIKSVTLKSFRKVIGYDTFDAIRKGSRSETKDVNEYYNVTVSMLVMREPAAPAVAAPIDTFQGGKTLKEVLDKGFPYDDGDVDVTEKAAAGQLGRMSAKAIIGKLNGENVTRQSLKNLVTDTTTPVTASLVQLDSEKSDADGLFKLMDANVTRGNLKNLVTDKPAPITVALAQTEKSDADGLFKLMDANVTRGNLKNLVTDKPAPITVALAQKSDADGLFKLMDANVTRGNLKNLVTDKPAPITVALAQKSDADGLFKLMDANVTRGNLKNLVTDKPAPITVALAQKSDADGLFKLMDANVTRGNLKNLVTDKPAPITVALAQKSDADGLFKLMDANVTRGNLKNLVTDKPAPITVALAQKDVPVLVHPESMLMPNTEAAVSLGLNNMEIGPDEVSAVQLDAKNPVANPPFNNWSVNQPAPIHDHGDAGNQDLELRDVVIDGVNGYDLVQTKSHIEPLGQENKPGNLNVIDRNPSVNLAQIEPLGSENKPGNFNVIDRNPSVNLAQIEPLGTENQPGNLVVTDRNPSVNLAQVEPLGQENKPGNLVVTDRNPTVNL